MRVQYWTVTGWGRLGIYSEKSGRHCQENRLLDRSGFGVGCEHGYNLLSPASLSPVVIQHAVWLYLRFTLSYRDVEELLAERGLDISYESVRSWVLKFGPAIARALRRCRPRPSDRWHLDEMVVRIAGKHMYLWRAVDHEGEVLDILVQRRRDKRAAVKLMRKLLRKQGFAPQKVTTDKLRSYGAAFQHLGLSCHHEQGLRQNTSTDKFLAGSGKRFDRELHAENRVKDRGCCRRLIWLSSNL